MKTALRMTASLARLVACVLLLTGGMAGIGPFAEIMREKAGVFADPLTLGYGFALLYASWLLYAPAVGANEIIERMAAAIRRPKAETE